MIRILAAVLVLSVLGPAGVFAQDTLPAFSAVSKGNNRNVISWTNTYPFISQLSIQRSTDSLKNFKTILTVPDPLVPQNGFVDTKAPQPNMFYRLFIVMDSGKYVFSKSKKPGPDTAKTADILTTLTNEKRILLSDSMTGSEVSNLKEKLLPRKQAAPKPGKFFVIKRTGSPLAAITEKDYKKFRDSMVYTTKDTIIFQSADTILIKPFKPTEIYKASQYVYTEKFGNVMISLPEAATKQYSLKFFEENKTEIFEIKQVNTVSLVVDKANFLHAGWFWFELYEGGKLKEKHKLFIPKDF